MVANSKTHKDNSSRLVTSPQSEQSCFLGHMLSGGVAENLEVG